MDYGMAWRHGMVYSMVTRAYGMICPFGHGMLYGLAWRACCRIWFG